MKKSLSARRRPLVESLEQRICLSAVSPLSELIASSPQYASIIAPLVSAPPKISGKPAAAVTSLTAPANVLATAVSATQINLSWQSVSKATGYYVYRSTDGTNFTRIATTSSTSFSNTALAAQTTYTYLVTAYAKAVTSPNSAPATATTPATAPNPAPTPDPTPTPTPDPTTFTTDPISITLRYGNELVLAGTSGNDSIYVSQSGNTLTITANGTTTTAAAPAAGLFIYSDYGADAITVDSSVTLRTTVAAIDGSTTTINSAGANVSLWIDSADAFSGTGTVHRVNAFYNNVAKTLGLNIADPTDAGTFRPTGSLWGTGPDLADINQGGVGDCYFLSSLSAFAKSIPAKLQEMAVDLGDGTYVVQYMRGGTPSFVRVDADIAAGGWNGFAFDHPGASGTLWGVVMEKSYALFRTGANTYASLNSGWMGNVYSDLGINSTSLSLGTTQSSFTTTVTNALNAGKPVTFATFSSGTTLVASHAYTLVSVSTNASGQTVYTVRNPWGVSGDSLENAAGYATLTFAQMQANFTLGCMAT